MLDIGLLHPGVCATFAGTAQAGADLADAGVCEGGLGHEGEMGGGWTRPSGCSWATVQTGREVHLEGQKGKERDKQTGR